jgi:plasmid stabilization system protein ParE
MNAPFQFTPQATDDLDAIWWFIAEDNRDAADRVETEIIATCRRLAKHPLFPDSGVLSPQGVAPFPTGIMSIFAPALTVLSVSLELVEYTGHRKRRYGRCRKTSPSQKTSFRSAVLASWVH